TGRNGFWRIANAAGAGEGRLGQQLRRIPADALPREAPARVVWIDAIGKRSLFHVLNAAKAPGREGKAGGTEVVSAATGNRHGSRREAANAPVEAEGPLGRRGDDLAG